MKKLLFPIILLFLCIESLAIPIVVIGRNTSIYEYNSTANEIAKQYVGNQSAVSNILGNNSYIYYGIGIGILLITIFVIIVFILGYKALKSSSGSNPYFH